MAWAVLKITDGTKANTVNLLAKNTGWHLKSWKPATAKYKAGGIWVDNAMSHGRKLSMRRFENIVETMETVVVGQCFDSVVFQLRKLRKLFEKAADYWELTFESAPIYVEARALHETNTRYAAIYAGSVPEDADLASPEFMRDAVANGINITFEHALWQSSIPNDAAALSISSMDNLFNVSPWTMGQGADANVYVGNNIVKPLTYVNVYDASTGLFSGNLIETGTPYNLLPLLPANGDIIYFGGDLSAWPFNSLVFNIGTAAVYGGAASIVFEYYDGAAWTLIPDFILNGCSAQTKPFDTVGKQTLHFQPPSDWDITIIDGNLSLYARARVIIGGGDSVTSPIQITEDVCTAALPYVDITALSGDVYNAMKMILRNTSTILTGEIPPANRFIIAARTKSRGPTFRGYIGVGGGEADITVTQGTNCAFVYRNDYPNGALIRYTAPGVDTMESRVYIAIATPTSLAYRGKFRVFVVYYSADADFFTFRLSAYLKFGGSFIAAPAFVGDEHQLLLSATSTVVDLGEIDLPMANVRDVNTDVAISIDASSTAAGVIDIQSVWLVPVDECVIDTMDNMGGATYLLQDYALVVDDTNLDGIKSTLRATITSTNIIAQWMTIGTGFKLRPDVDYRIWFYAMYKYAHVPNVWIWDQGIVHNVQMYNASMYMSHRGDM